jgi:hypothetical protein
VIRIDVQGCCARKPRAGGDNRRQVRNTVSSVRAELLDHAVVFNEDRLRRLLAEYVLYYNIDRCRLALDKDALLPKEVRPVPQGTAGGASPGGNGRLDPLRTLEAWSPLVG